MVIGFDGSRAFHAEKTGTENYSYQLLKHLSKIDTENRYLVYIGPGSKVDLKEWPANFTFKKINFPRLWTQLGLALSTFVDRIDILFVPAHTLPLLRRPRLKTVMTIHDLGAEYLPRTHQLKQRLYLGFITKFQLKSATKLIAVSKATKEDIIKKVGVNSEKIEVIYEGVSEEFLEPFEDELLRDILKHFKVGKQNYFLFVGTIQPRKNLSSLIEAYDSFLGPFKNTPKLVLAGSKGWLSGDIYRLTTLLGLEGRVIFTGRVSDQELRALYKGATALVFPSLYEGFGLPILEAFASSCPVIASKNSSIPEVGADAAIYIEDPKDVNSIGYSMLKLLKQTNQKNKDRSLSKSFKIDLKERDRLVKKGEVQLKKFSWEKAARETLKVLQIANSRL